MLEPEVNLILVNRDCGDKEKGTQLQVESWTMDLQEYLRFLLTNHVWVHGAASSGVHLCQSGVHKICVK